MILYRYMVGDALAGGCVTAYSVEEAERKVRAFYNELATCSDSNADYEDAEITVWKGGEGFVEEIPCVVEVY